MMKNKCAKLIKEGEINMKVSEMTIKQAVEYYNSEKCDVHCSDTYCPLHCGNCCLLDVVGEKRDFKIKESYLRHLGIEFDENLKVIDVIRIILNKEVN